MQDHDDDAVQAMLADLDAGIGAEEADEEEEAVSASARAAAARRADADRKRSERARRRSTGAPDPRTVDAAVASGLAAVMAANDARQRIGAAGSIEGFRIPLRSTVQASVRYLIRLGVQREAAVKAVHARLFG